jgi:hypothetical protein
LALLHGTDINLPLLQTTTYGKNNNLAFAIHSWIVGVRIGTTDVVIVIFYRHFLIQESHLRIHSNCSEFMNTFHEKHFHIGTTDVIRIIFYWY